METKKTHHVAHAVEEYDRPGVLLEEVGAGSGCQGCGRHVPRGRGGRGSRPVPPLLRLRIAVPRPPRRHASRSPRDSSPPLGSSRSTAGLGPPQGRPRCRDDHHSPRSLVLGASVVVQERCSACGLGHWCWPDLPSLRSDPSECKWVGRGGEGGPKLGDFGRLPAMGRDRTSDLLALAERLGNEVSAPLPFLPRLRDFSRSV